MKAITSILTVLALSSFTLSAAEGDAPEKKKGDPAKVFAKVDANGDGFVSKEEWAETPQAKKDAEKAAKAFERKDTDGDGKLSKEEFVAPQKKKKDA